MRLRQGVLVATALALAACGSSSSSTGGDGGGLIGADGSSGSSGGPGDGGSSGNPGDGGSSGNSGDGGFAPGTCLAPTDITLDFTAPADATTKDSLDVTTLTCSNQVAGLPEVVYRLVLAAPTTVKLTGSDKSGSGIGVQVRQDSCTGTSVGCDWQGNGVLDRTYPLTAGTWVFVVERKAAGPFALTISR